MLEVCPYYATVQVADVQGDVYYLKQSLYSELRVSQSCSVYSSSYVSAGINYVYLPIGG